MKDKSRFVLPISRLSSQPDNLAWFCMKLSLASLSCIFLLYVLYHRSEQPFPSGICQWVDCSRITHEPIRIALTALLLLTAALYVLEKKMEWTCLVLGLLSTLILSLEESNGNPAENGILSLVFVAQSLAYWVHRIRPGERLNRNRIQFPAQLFAAVYTLAAISKLQVSGLAWFTDDSPRFALEVLRVHFSDYATYGLINSQIRGYAIAQFIENHALLTKMLLGLALLLELGSCCLFLSRKLAPVYTLLLLCMHLGFYLTLGIFFPTIILPLVVVFLNPLYFVVKPFLAPIKDSA